MGAPGFAGDQGLTVSTLPGQQTHGATLGAPELKLRLRDAVELALKHNLDLEVSRLGLAQVGEGVIASSGIFDPLAQATLSQASQDSPATNLLEGAGVTHVKQRTFNVQFGQLIPTGGNYGVSWANSRTDINSIYYYLNPSYQSTFGLSFTQPLLKGFGSGVTRTAIEVAKRNRDQSALKFEQTVIGTIQQVEEAYWNLVYQRENLEVKKQSLKNAQDLLDQTRTRVRIGTSPPIDIVQSEATVAAREQDIIVAENALATAGDVLKQLMGFESVADWKTVISPIETLETTALTPEMDAAIAQALAARLEVRERALDQDIARLNLNAAENAVLPTLNLALGYGFLGAAGALSGSPPQGLNPSIVGGWGDALHQITGFDYPQWTAGLNLAYTFGNHQMKAQRAQARFQSEIALQSMAVQKQGIIEQTRLAVRTLQDSAKSIAASVKARELAERNADAELKKFANGMSTNYQVLKIQEDLAIAQVNELFSRVTYRKAVTAYHASIGDLLAVRGIELKNTDEKTENKS
jgi:outer membrane protein TolC